MSFQHIRRKRNRELPERSGSSTGSQNDREVFSSWVKCLISQIKPEVKYKFKFRPVKCIYEMNALRRNHGMKIICN